MFLARRPPPKGLIDSSGSIPAVLGVRIGVAMLKIDSSMILRLEADASKHPRRRSCIVLSVPSDPAQSLINAIAPGSYSSPHYWRGMKQSYTVINGELFLLFFDQEGDVTSIRRLKAGETLLIRADDPEPYHSLVAPSSPGTILEVLDGPYLTYPDGTPINRANLAGFPPEVGWAGDDESAARRREQCLAEWIEAISDHNFF